MGLYDTLFAPLKCSASGIEKKVEIQFKWADPCLNEYHLGDQLEIGPYGNIWIPDDYACEQCSKYEPAEIGRKVNKLEFHIVFIHLNKGKFEEVLSEEDFSQRYVREGTVVLPEDETLFIRYFNFKEGKPAYLKELKVPL